MTFRRQEDFRDESEAFYCKCFVVTFIDIVSAIRDNLVCGAKSAIGVPNALLEIVLKNIWIEIFECG